MRRNLSFSLQLKPTGPFFLLLAGPLRPGHGAVSLQRRQHDRVPHPQHGELSGDVHHREVVDGAATGPAQTGLGPAGWIHDGRPDLCPCCLRNAHSCDRVEWCVAECTMGDIVLEALLHEAGLHILLLFEEN